MTSEISYSEMGIWIGLYIREGKKLSMRYDKYIEGTIISTNKTTLLLS